MTPSPTPDFLTRLRHDWAQVRPDLDPDPMLLLVLLDRLHAALRGQIEQTYLPSGVNAAGWDLLLTLYRSAPPGGLTPTQLSELAAISGPSMTNRIQRLMGKGLIERRNGEADRRSVRVQLTGKGHRLVEQLLPEHLASTARLLSGLPPTERQKLWHLAAQLLMDIETATPDQGSKRGPE